MMCDAVLCKLRNEPSMGTLCGGGFFYSGVVGRITTMTALCLSSHCHQTQTPGTISRITLWPKDE